MNTKKPSPMPDPISPLRMPAEWEPHQATWLSWLHNEDTWLGNLDKVIPVYAQMVAALAHSERVHINVVDAAMEASAREVLHQAGAVGDIRFHHVPTNDAWCRDHGGIIVCRQQPQPMGARCPSAVVLDWQYNAWGNKYPPYDLDNNVPRHIATILGLDYLTLDMILEGGSIDVNGEGLLLTTEACLLNPNRNPQLSRAEIEQRLGTMLGIERVLWLGDGIVGDDTDGHIDDLTRFVAPNTVVTVVEDDPSDANYAALQDNLRRLQTMRDLHGKPLHIVTLPMPAPVVYEGQRLPASYANFYIANTIVLLPTYNCPQDQQAHTILQQLFPAHQVIDIDCTDLVLGLGAFHCLTQQIPA